MATRRHLVVVLPGIGGSVLADPRGRTVWDVAFADLVGAARHPLERLSLDEAPDLRPVGLIRSRHWLPGWTVIHGYDGLERRLAELPGAVVAPGRSNEPVPDANVVLFPYDFRRSVAHAAERLAAEVTWRLERFGGDSARRVILVAHSMGGLVARFWLGPLGGWRVCRALITLGTPFRGAPKALQWTVNGPLLGLLPGVTKVLRGWPSVAELMPRYPAVWDEIEAVARYPHELPIDWLAKAAGEAYALHEHMDSEWRNAPVGDVDARLGFSHPTLREARWNGERLRVTKEPARWLDLYGWEDDRGDGTVPAFCAVPLESSQANPLERRVVERHTSLAAASFIPGLIEGYETFASLEHVRGPAGKHPPAVGLDVEVEHVAGAPVALAATIEGDGVGKWPPRIAVTVRVAGRAKLVRELFLDLGPECYRGEVTGLEPGLYDVTVRAADVPGAGDLTATESIALVAE